MFRANGLAFHFQMFGYNKFYYYGATLYCNNPNCLSSMCGALHALDDWDEFCKLVNDKLETIKITSSKPVKREDDYYTENYFSNVSLG